jgi:large exoprotein involved in heme utilization and adhesion
MLTATETLTLTGVAANNTFPSGILATTEGRAGGAGAAGNIVVSAPRILITDGAAISSSSFGAGHGGNLTVRATDSIAITGGSVDNQPGLKSLANATGDAGNVFVSAPMLTITDYGRILARTLGDSNAGDIDVRVSRLTLTGGGQIFNGTGDGQGGGNPAGSGRGGNQSVTAMDSIFIAGQSSEGISSGLFSSAQIGSGRAGNLSVSTPTLTMMDGGQISTSTSGPGQGGKLTVTATGSMSITRQNSEGLQTGLFSSTNGSGDGGGLLVSTPLLVMADGRITTDALASSMGNAGSLTLEVGSLRVTDGAQISSGTSGSGQGGNQSVTATDSIFIAGQSSEGFQSGLFSSAQIGSGRAGNLSVSTPTLTMMDGGQISTSTSTRGRGGDLRVVATEAISITGRGSELPQTGLFSVANASGDAGQLFISTPRLEVAGGRILTRTLGDSNAGDLEVHVGSLMLSEGGQIFSGTGFASNSGIIGTEGPGRGGNLTIRATHSISIAGSDRQGFPSGLFSSAQTGSGRAGNLSVSTPLLTLNDGGLIAADTLSTSSGNAGNIEVWAGRLTLSGGSQISSSTSSSGRGGDVTVAATDRIVLSSGGTISASSSGLGDAGNIMIQAGQIFQSRNGAVTTEAEQADGGNIQLTVGSLVELRNSQITATVKSGVGKGGNITIDPQFVVMQGSQVRADAFGGPGGNVRIVAGVFLADPESRVSASSALGINGVVNIQAPVTSISGAVAPLPQEFARISELLRDRCAGRLREGRVSRLVLGGRDGVPSEPGSLLLSPLIQMDPRENGEQVRTPARTGQVQERAWHVQAGTLAELEAECARWTGNKSATVGNNTSPRWSMPCLALRLTGPLQADVKHPSSNERWYGHAQPQRAFTAGRTVGHNGAYPVASERHTLCGAVQKGKPGSKPVPRSDCTARRIPSGTITKGERNGK